MKVIFITNHFINLTGGGSFASRAFINAFSEISDELYLYYPDYNNENPSTINKNVILRPVTNNKTRLKKLIEIYKGYINRFKNILSEIKKIDPDLVVFDNSRASAGLIRKIRKEGYKIVTIHHNYEIEYYKGSPPNFLLRFPFMYFMKNAERDAVVYSDLNLTLTKQDLDLLNNHYPNDSNFEVIGIFEYSSFLTDKCLVKNKNKNFKSFAITGSLSTYQSQVTIVDFLNNYFPLLLNNFPDANLIIAGHNPSKYLTNLCKQFENVTLIANPVNMNEIIENANYYICPVSVGGGIKLRVMDGLKEGLPTLVHKVSSRGYEKFERANCLFSYDDPETFESQLFKIEDVRDRAQGRIIYKNIFSFNAGVNRLKEILDKYEI